MTVTDKRRYLTLHMYIFKLTLQYHYLPLFLNHVIMHPYLYIEYRRCSSVSYKANVCMHMQMEPLNNWIVKREAIH
jgi:hypothetical protein